MSAKKLAIKKLSVSCGNTAILHNLEYSIAPGQLHAFMGPNGSGKSSLALTLMGHPAYNVTAGTVLFDGVDITCMPVHKRAQAGLFLSFQQPYEIPGVSVASFVKAAYDALHGTIEPRLLQEKAFCFMHLLAMDQSLWFRNVHDGFSGGQKKKLELLQLLLLRPMLAILDEIDSGLDVDALQVVAKALMVAREQNPSMSVVIITHYQRILHYIQPDSVYVLCDGRIVQSGDAQLAQQIEQQGYSAYEAQK